MINPESPLPPRDALDPGELLRQIYLRKWILIALTLLAGAGVYLYSRFLPNTYEASAGIILRTPEVLIAGEAGPLDAEALHALADSTEVKGEAFRAVKSQNLLDETVEFGSFLKALNVQIVETRAKKDDHEPLIRLLVAFPSAETAASIANAWADAVIVRTHAIYATGIEDLSRFIGNLSRVAEHRLEESAEASVLKKTASNLQVKQAILERNNAVMSDAHAQWKKLEGEIAVKKALLDTVRRKIAEEEVDGRWIGEALYAGFKAGSSPKEAVAPTPQTRRIEAVIRSLLASEARLAELLEKSGGQQKTIELKNAAARLAEVLTEQAATESVLSSNEAKARAAQEELSALTPTLVLDKAITDDALWSAHLEGKMPSAAQMPPLKTEIMNPAYQNVSASLFEFKTKSQGALETLKTLKEQEAQLRGKIGALAGETALLDSEVEFYTGRIAADKAVLKVMEDEFAKKKREQEVLEAQLIRATAEAAEQEKTLSELVSASKALEEDILRAEREIASLERIEEKMRTVSASLASEAETIALLKDSTDHAARNSARILYRAYPDPKKMGPPRRKMVFAGMAACFFLLATGIVLREIMRES